MPAADAADHGAEPIFAAPSGNSSLISGICIFCVRTMPDSNQLSKPIADGCSTAISLNLLK